MILDAMKYRRRIKAWQKKYEALVPKVGDIAPDFELCDVKGEKPVRLSSFRGQKPVVLIFGNYT